MKKFRGFTFIEILVTVTIISLLTAVAVVTYSSFMKQARDAKRKADLGQISAALEMYRSNNDTYPVGSNWATTLNVLKSPVVYIQTLPTDPKNPTYIYYYSSTTGSDYTLGTHLENDLTTCQSLSTQCTYCLGPYGEK